ncbi:hypothetical protein NliqN6_1611 [Naganishia liquefaciens]|uniref:Glycosyltransferase family 28 N-terminal domain-containing protein n=1 Tax=Naganishia liquefaciens TaxID=104408 RepID=A0A8H3YDE2_9TREE|nr:hypothetical protein NliqN6_1611 [Naganishia liquefaciens]
MPSDDRRAQGQPPSYSKDGTRSLRDEADSDSGEEGKSQDPRSIETSGPGLQSKAELKGDGTIGVTLDAKTEIPDLPPDYALPVQEYGIDSSRPLRVPSLNIVIMIVGSRGDVQPYLAAALELIKTYGHRVRIATHDVFESFVLEQAAHLNGRMNRQGKPLTDNLEFFGIGGDPKDLMAYMVKNPGLIPGMGSLTNGDIGRKKAMIKEMIHNFYRSTFQPCPQNGQAFAADAIISNPPAFAHIHTAEALGIPLIMSFTMPWSATTEFSHPLVAIEQSNTPSRLTNYLTFAMAASLTWQGLGSTINNFRKKRLGLDKISLMSGASALDRLKLPYIYCWSSELIPKPKDWMQNIDITGFLFLSSPDYQPKPELMDFLQAGPTPIYVGFGSIVVDDPDAFTRLLFEAIKQSGVRALLSAGWSKMGNVDIPDNVFLLGDIPHDWLFAENRVSAVCIHGGAGTTAIALKNDLPVIVVPFFGDQPFWGAMIANRGAGPQPLPFKTLTAAKLAAAITYALSDAAKIAAAEVGTSIRNTDGAARFAESFHAHLPLLRMRCDIDPNRVARWWSERYALRLSSMAAEVLSQAGKLQRETLKAWRPCEYATELPPDEPAFEGAFGVLSAVTNSGELYPRVLSTSRRNKGLLTVASAPAKAAAIALSGVYEGLESLATTGTKEREFTRDGIENAKRPSFGNRMSVLAQDTSAGLKKSGFGLAKSLVRIPMNLAVKPAVGIAGLLVRPVAGVGKAISDSFNPNPESGENVLRLSRTAIGVQQAMDIDLRFKQDVLAQFDLLASKVEDRRRAIRKEAGLRESSGR